jgi:hypothetical protein
MAKKKIKEPSNKNAKKCIELRRLRKQDEDIGAEAHFYCTKMYGKYPDWYSKMEERVFKREWKRDD